MQQGRKEAKWEQERRAEGAAESEGLSSSPQHQQGPGGCGDGSRHQHSTRQSRGRGATNREAQLKDNQLFLPDSKAHNGWEKSLKDFPDI